MGDVLGLRAAAAMHHGDGAFQRKLDDATHVNSVELVVDGGLSQI